MKKNEAINELKGLTNLRGSHAVLMRNDVEGYYTELHAGNAGDCLCCDYVDFVWRQEEGYVNPDCLDVVVDM